MRAPKRACDISMVVAQAPKDGYFVFNITGVYSMQKWNLSENSTNSPCETHYGGETGENDEWNTMFSGMDTATSRTTGSSTFPYLPDASQ